MNPEFIGSMIKGATLVCTLIGGLWYVSSEFTTVKNLAAETAADVAELKSDFKRFSQPRNRVLPGSYSAAD